MSLDAISVYGFFEITARHREEGLVLRDLWRGKVDQFDREKVIRFSLIEQGFDQFLLVEAFTLRESFPHGNMGSQPYRKSCSVKGLGGKAKKVSALAVRLVEENEGKKKDLLLVPSFARYR